MMIEAFSRRPLDLKLRRKPCALNKHPILRLMNKPLVREGAFDAFASLVKETFDEVVVIW
jgi:hypothetical protein